MMYACALRLFQLQQLTRDSFTFTSDGQKMYVTCNVKKTNSCSDPKGCLTECGGFLKLLKNFLATSNVRRSTFTC